ncbi:MAG: hypothetical protein IT343_14130 [Candidatus Melainabacteria bacterium]|nr:hypothetical protein [Candidatus Melainabacteria bacterium]
MSASINVIGATWEPFQPRSNIKLNQVGELQVQLLPIMRPWGKDCELAN